MFPRSFIGTVVFLACVVTATAQEPIRFARTPDISHDGKLVAFSYLGDIWTVEAIGGVARPVTMHEAHDYFPCISPDGTQIAFSSNRHGSYDVFVVSIRGGKPKRLTFDSGMDVVNGWTPDGKSIVFSSSRSTGYPGNLEVYTVPVTGGAETRLNLFEGKEAYFSPDGKSIAFVRGPGTWYRKGYRGSSNDDIWLANPDGSNTRRFTMANHQDTSPMWSADGKKMYFVSEAPDKPGIANIVQQDVQQITSQGSLKALTSHSEDFVRRARISKNGEWIVYECGADLWVVNTKSGQNRKLAIEVHADDKSNTERSVTYTRDATEYALSPDESHAVIVVHGELFLTKVPTGGKATRLTDNPAFDGSPAWSPDGKKIVFTSDRTGVNELYLLEPDDVEHPEMTKAHKFKTTKLTDSADEETGASFSPKGEAIVFMRGGKLWTMKPDGKEQKILIDHVQVVDYDWSPDGKHIVYARQDGSFASEIFIASVDGSFKPRNISRYATFNGDVTWSNTGGKIAFISQRRGSYSMHVLSLFKPTADGSSPGRSAEIDWEDIHLRVERASSLPADGGSISPDGSQVAFRSISSNGDDLWVAGSDGRSTTRLTTGNQSPRGIRWSKKASGLIYFLNRDGELRAMRSAGASPLATAMLGGSANEPQRIAFNAKMTINRDEEYAEMFTQGWRTLGDYFYDEKHHGADWNKVRKKYSELVPHVATREDLYALVNLMLGELNASHLGISGRMPMPEEQTADLGLIFDEKHTGPGLKIAEVLKRGPADKRGLNLKVGEIILSIDRTDLNDKLNLSKLLNNKVGEMVLVDVTSNPSDTKAKRRIEMKAESRDRISNLMYDRWVQKNADQVSKESNGKVGYIHIPGMDESGLEVFVRSLYSDNFDKDAIVLDVRNNGGGFTHDQVMNYLTGKEHTIFRQRNGGEGLVLRSFDRKWSKPLSLLINNRSYSDAEIFPNAFRTVGLGKVVGEATGGHVIGTYSTRLIDGSSFRIPRTGVFTVKGVNMEKEGVKPDVPVEQTFSDWQKGHDTQLSAALKVVQEDVVMWKKARGLPVATAEETKPTPTPMTPTKSVTPTTKTGGN